MTHYWLTIQSVGDTRKKDKQRLFEGYTHNYNTSRITQEHSSVAIKKSITEEVDIVFMEGVGKRSQSCFIQVLFCSYEASASKLWNDWLFDTIHTSVVKLYQVILMNFNREN